MKNIIPLLFFLIGVKLSPAQIINSSFEKWDTVYTPIYYEEIADTFKVPNAKGGKVNGWKAWSGFGICRTTDSYSGNYSLVLHNWYRSSNESIVYRDSINSRPKFLRGYFKYITGGLDPVAHGSASVTFTRFNGASNDVIGSGVFQFDSTVVFTPFQIPVNYISSLAPDSFTLFFNNAFNHSCNGRHLVCNFLYLDDLALSNYPLGATQVAEEAQIAISPNPATTTLSITATGVTEVSIVNLLGEIEYQVASSKYQDKRQIDVRALASGIYFIRLKGEDGSEVVRKFVKE